MKNIVLIAFTLAVTACSGVAADAPVTGVYRAEGKDASLSFVRTAKGEPRMHEPTIDFAFTEKDASDAKDLSSSTIAFSHKYGSAITMTIVKNSDGAYEVDESAFHHSGSDKVGGTAGGVLQIKDVTVANGVISGEVYTKPDTKIFDAKADIDLKFKAPLPK